VRRVKVICAQHPGKRLFIPGLLEAKNGKNRRTRVGEAAVANVWRLSSVCIELLMDVFDHGCLSGRCAPRNAAKLVRSAADQSPQGAYHRSLNFSGQETRNASASRALRVACSDA
jgi:hypothetical protein